MTNDTMLRLELAREGLHVLPPSDGRGILAMNVLDHYLVGQATRRQLLFALDVCRDGFKVYACQAKRERSPAQKARVRAWCHALFAVYDVLDRVAHDRVETPTPRRESALKRWERAVVRWWKGHPPEFELVDEPYRTPGRRAA